MIQTPGTDFPSSYTCTNPKLEAELFLLNR